MKYAFLDFSGEVGGWLASWVNSAHVLAMARDELDNIKL